MEAKILEVKQTVEGMTVRVGFFEKDIEVPAQTRPYYLKVAETVESLYPQIKKDLMEFEEIKAKVADVSKMSGQTLDLSKVEIEKEPEE